MTAHTLSSTPRTVLGVLPRGNRLPAETWARRHRTMVWLLWMHVAILPAFALLNGHDLATSLGMVMPIAFAGVAATLSAASPRARSVAVVFGLLTASAVLVKAWDGQIEAHFHFFVIIAVLALYEDWLPFGLAISYVLIEHGVLGAISPTSVYNHGGNPWAWAGVHAAFVLGSVAAAVTTWQLNEQMRARMETALEDLSETSARFRIAFESGVSGMALVGPDGRFLKVNQALCDMVGRSAEELQALTFQSITHPDDLAADVDQQRAMSAGTVDSYETEKRYMHRDGTEVWMQVGVTAVRGPEGETLYFISQFHDVTRRRRFADELAHRALHDPLTGLANRALFVDRVHHALVRLRRHSGSVTVMFVDLDRFKLVNDGMGHAVGDTVLVDAARRLSEAVRSDDTVARFGGDEYTILCENADETTARLIAERVLEAFAAPFVHEDREFHLGASIGIRVNDLASADPDGLLRDADIALYAAKERGRGRFEVFDSESQSEVEGVDLLASEQALRLALRDGQLCLHYQPEIDLATGRVIAVEALVRWNHPEQGLLPPGAFIPAAESSGLIGPLGEWVLREACMQVARWRHDGSADHRLRVAVNVSPRQLSDRRLPQIVEEALAAAKLDATALCLEITETAIIQDPVVARENLGVLKALGVTVALDDFGVGFSSLSQIRDLPPIDIIKVDRSFTAGLGTNESDEAVVTAVMSLADSLGLTAVVEGVETAEQLERVTDMGYHVGQGYFFARPLVPGDLARMLTAQPHPVVQG